MIKLNLLLHFGLLLLFCIDSAFSMRHRTIRREQEVDVSYEPNKHELVSDDEADLRGSEHEPKKYETPVEKDDDDDVEGIDEIVNGILDETKKYEAALQKNKSNGHRRTEVTESPIDTLIAITRSPIQFVHTLLIGNETSKQAREISDIIGYNLKKIVKKIFKIANEALDNFNTINNAGLVSAIVQIANFMTKVNQFVSPTQWQSTLMGLDLAGNLRLPLNLRSPNAHHEQIFDDVNELL